MSQRRKPSELRVVQATEAGEVIEAEAPLSEAEEKTEEKLENYRSKLVSGSGLLAMPPRKWLVPNWLPLDSVSVLYSAPGVGKSFFALTLALELARGGRAIGAKVEETRVLYVAAERPVDIRDRAEAWSEYHSSDIPENLILLPEAPQLSQKSDTNALAQLITEGEFRVVILDTYARMTLGIEENSAKDTGPIMNSLDILRRATNEGLVLAVHHAGKDSSRGLRGSSSFLGAVDLTLELRNENGLLRASVEKSNAGRSPLPEWYKLEPLTLDPTPGEHERREAAVLIHTGAPVLDPENEKLILGLFETELGERASKREILDALERMSDTTGKQIAESTLERYLGKLVKSQKLTKSGQGRSTRYALTEPLEAPSELF